MPRTSAEVTAEVNQHVYLIGAHVVNAHTAIMPALAALARLSDELKAARDVEAAVEASKPKSEPTPTLKSAKRKKSR